MLLKFIREQKLKKGLLNGDGASIEALFGEYAANLFKYALGITLAVDDAEEVVQRFFLKLVRNPAAIRDVRNLKAYFYASIRNEALNFIRGRKGEISLDDKIFEIPANPENNEERLMIEESLKSLSLEQREIVVLKIYHGMAFREIADTLEISQNTAASRYRYAIENLRKIMGGN